jgi:hypothetical protein
VTHINSSPHAARGSAVCSRAGQCVWYGPIEQLPKASDFDTVHCHEDDVDLVRDSLVEQSKPSVRTVRLPPRSRGV